MSYCNFAMTSLVNVLLTLPPPLPQSDPLPNSQCSQRQQQSLILTACRRNGFKWVREGELLPFFDVRFFQWIINSTATSSNMALLPIFQCPQKLKQMLNPVSVQVNGFLLLEVSELLQFCDNFIMESFNFNTAVAFQPIWPSFRHWCPQKGSIALMKTFCFERICSDK